MANSTEAQRNHVRFICCCITLLGVTCAVCGTLLIWKGYHGDLLIGGTLAAVSGLCGFLGAGKPTLTQPDITLSTEPPRASVTQLTQKEETKV